MIEFGAEQHFYGQKYHGSSLFKGKNLKYFATGRNALSFIAKYHGWRRIWIPEYYNNLMIDYLRRISTLDICFYPDSPFLNDNESISRIVFTSGDVLLRCNMFGLRQWRDNRNISVPVIEDHSYDLIGDWAKNSNADYAFASLRKTLPVPEGGILWSPKGHKMDFTLPVSTVENEITSYKRVSAMLLKTLYLQGEYIQKSLLKEGFEDTEESFKNMTICSINPTTQEFFQNIDIEKLYSDSKANWIHLADFESDKVHILKPEDITKCNPYQLMVQLKTKESREWMRVSLIENHVYPSIFNATHEASNPIKDIASTLLAIPCDARYNPDNISELKDIILGIHKLLR